MKLVCFDNHVLIWGIKEEASPGQEDMIPRAKSFIKELDESNTKVLIPSVVIAEFLMRIPPEAHTTITNLFSKSFLVASFDTAAASHFATIWQAKKNQGGIAKIQEEMGTTREELKVDALIVATAVSHQVERIYSHDRGVKAFGEGFVDVQEVPFIPSQYGMNLPKT
tara:strand:+ start:51 stop:551 length:501 start_codon:yes stop_codon:yes gene_type:complete